MKNWRFSPNTSRFLAGSLVQPIWAEHDTHEGLLNGYLFQRKSRLENPGFYPIQDGEILKKFWGCDGWYDMWMMHEEKD